MRPRGPVSQTTDALLAVAPHPPVHRLPAHPELLCNLPGPVSLLDSPSRQQPGVLGQSSVSVSHKDLRAWRVRQIHPLRLEVLLRSSHHAVSNCQQCQRPRQLAVAVSAANTHDSLGLMPLVQAVPAVRSRRGPRRRRPAKLHADKGYDYEHLRAWLRARGITSRIARRGVETSTRLGRHRWIIERSFAWLTGYRQLTLRYERSARLFCAFLTLAATLTCYKNLLQEAHHMRHALRTWRWGPVVHKRRPWHAGRGGGSVRGRSVPHRSPRRRMACMTPGDLGRVP